MLNDKDKVEYCVTTVGSFSLLQEVQAETGSLTVIPLLDGSAETTQTLHEEGLMLACRQVNGTICHPLRADVPAAQGSRREQA